LNNILPKADIPNEETEHLIWLKNELSQIKGKFERYSELHLILKEELTRLGYWKQQPRGNPRKGFKASPVAQQTAEVRTYLRDYKAKMINQEDADD